MNVPRRVKLIPIASWVSLIAVSAWMWAIFALPCRAEDVQGAIAERRESPVTNIAYWKPALATPLEQRIGPAPEELVSYLVLDNIVQGIPNKPQAMVVSDEVLDDVKSALTDLPVAVRDLIAGNFVGIYFVRELGGTAYTQSVTDDGGQPTAGFIVLDMHVLGQHVANSWATWKESSPFIADPTTRLEAVLERSGENSRKNAIQYLLLHELGHVLSIGKQIHPHWTSPVSVDRSPDKYPFSKLSWTMNAAGTGYTSLFEGGFTKRKDVAYYFGASLAADQMVPAYEQLEQTNFVTLYGTTKPVEDFAEAFASYVHTVLLKRPQEIRIYREDMLLKTYHSCWEEARCAEKRKIIEELLKLGAR